jgi:hypothetical protein
MTMHRRSSECGQDEELNVSHATDVTTSDVVTPEPANATSTND